MAPPGNQAATEKTNEVRAWREKPAYSPNPHAACEVAGIGDGATARIEAPALAERRWQQLLLGPKTTAPILDPTIGQVHDVTALAAALEIEKFAVVGVSGGGPGALACTWMIPGRLSSVGMVACPAPTDAPGVFEGMSKTNRFFMNLAWRLPWLSTLNVRLLAAIIRRNPSRYLNTMKFKVHDVDKAILARPEIQEMLAKPMTPSGRQWPEAAALVRKATGRSR